MNETKHTPTPWKTGETIEGQVFINPDDNEFFTVARVLGFSSIEAKANAQFIVTAVNAHDDLVAALKEIIGCAKIMHIPIEGDVFFCGRNLWDKALAALKKASP